MPASSPPTTRYSENTWLQKSLSDHHYPALLWQHPRLIKLLHIWNFIFLQRNCLSLNILNKKIAKLSLGAKVADAGCGDGHHLFSLWKKFPGIRFLGLDKNKTHIAFCRRLTECFSEKHLLIPQFFSGRLEDSFAVEKVDLVYCIGTLQYIPEDERVLENFYNLLKVNGEAIIYSPVNGRTVLPFYRYFFEKMNHYEKAQQRQRIYTPDALMEKIAAAGFSVSQTKFSHGPAGIVAHEWYSLLLMGLGARNLLVAAIAAASLLMTFPLILLLGWTDYFLPKKTGNGMLITAYKMPK